MIQEFLIVWVNWYYGNNEYPLELQSRMTYEQRIECVGKTEQIKTIIGSLN